MKNRTKLKEAHKYQTGSTSICSILWSSNANHIITASSSDDSIYIHDAVSSDNSPKVLRNHLDGVTALTLSPDSTCLASGSVDHLVKLYKFPSGNFERTITRSTLPIRAIAFNKSGSLLAAAGDGEGLRLFDTIDDWNISRVLKGHRGPVTSVDFDPKKEYFASLDSFGTVIVWELKSGRIIHELENLAPNHGSSVSTMNILAWSPDGDLLAVPGLRNDVVMYDRDTAEKLFVLRGDHMQPVCFLSWSPNGKYMATSSLDKQILIWDVDKRQDIERQKFTECISSMAWKPQGNSLAVIDVIGKYGVWESVVPSTMKSPTEDIPGVHSRSSNAFLSLDNEEEDEPSASGSFSDLNEDILEELEPSRKRLRKRSKYEEEWEENLDDLLDDIPKVESRKKSSHSHKVKTSGKNGLLNMEVSSGSKMQEPFQPGFTPVRPGKRNFLCYNMLGSITTMQHDGYSHIEIDFHDTSSGPRVPAMTDYFGFTMASLNENGSVFANPCKGEKNMSTLMYRPFSTWANNSEWSMRFEGEEVRAIALGSDWVAAVTSLNFLRIFTVGGLQRNIVSLDGPVVTAVGYKDELVIVTHSSPSLPSDEQMLEFRVFNVPRETISTRGRLPLTPGSCLTWFGFSEEGQLSSFDSKGVLRIFTNQFGGSWPPLFSASKLKKPEENYWVAGLNANKLFCIVCKSPETFPQSTPKPVLTLLDLLFPLASSDLGADNLENEFMMNNMHLSQIQRSIEEREAAGFDTTPLEEEAFNLELSLDRCILRLISSCCNGDKLARATELVKLLSLEKSVIAAIKLVTALKLTNLADRFNEILEEKMRREKERNNTVPVPAHNSSNCHNNGTADVASIKSSNVASIKSSNTQETIRIPESVQVPPPLHAFPSNPFTRKRNGEELTKDGSGKSERVYPTVKAEKTTEAKVANTLKDFKEGSSGDNKKAKEADQLTPSRPSNPFAKSSSNQGGPKTLFESLKKMKKASVNGS